MCPQPIYPPIGKSGFRFLDFDMSVENDILTPVLAKLAARHLAKVTDKNEIDKVFSNALAKHPNITDDFLKKLVDDFKEIPSSQLDRKFPSFVIKESLLSPVSIQKVRANLAGLPSGPIAGTRPVLRPHVNKLEPRQPPFGYSPGEQLFAVGFGFSEQPGKNHIEIWYLDPDKPEKKYDVEPIDQIYYKIKFALPPDIDPGTWHLKVVVDRVGESDFVAFRVTSTELIIHRIEPAEQEPGGVIIITGENFKANKIHEIVFTSLDLLEPEPFQIKLDAIPRIDQETTQFEIQLPNEILGGNYHVQIFHKDTVTPPSQLVTFKVGVPEYRLIFNKLHCYDITNRSYTMGGIGTDLIVTHWIVIVDGKFWTKKTISEYLFAGNISGGFVVPKERSYSPEDGQVLNPSGDYEGVNYGLSIITVLYSTDDGNDIEFADSVIDLAGEVWGAMAKSAYGEMGKKASELVTAGLKKLIQWLLNQKDVTVGYDSNNPVAHPGAIAKFWTATELQSELPVQKSESGDYVLDFHGDDDHGWYKAWYKILRK